MSSSFAVGERPSSLTTSRVASASFLNILFLFLMSSSVISSSIKLGVYCSFIICFGSLIFDVCTSDFCTIDLLINKILDLAKKIKKNTGNAWTFPCFIQQISNDHQGSGSVVVSIGWLTFARKKDVRVGDKVFLHRKSLDDNSTGSTTRTTAQFRIEVKRKIRLLGQDIWAAVDIYQ